MVLRIHGEPDSTGRRGHSLAPFVDDSEAGRVCDGLVILGPDELGALLHLRALKHHGDHAVVVHIHINLLGSWEKNSSTEYVFIAMKR